MLAIYSHGDRKVSAAGTPSAASDAVTAALTSGEQIVTVATVSQICEIDPSQGLNFATSTAGNVIVGIINHAPVAGRCFTLSLEVASSAAATLTVASGSVFGNASAVNVPIAVGTNHYVLTQAGAGPWFYGKVVG